MITERLVHVGFLVGDYTFEGSLNRPLFYIPLDSTQERLCRVNEV